MSTTKLTEAQRRAKRSEMRDRLDAVSRRLEALLGIDPESQDIMLDPDGFIHLRVKYVERMLAVLDTDAGRATLRRES